jgi:hypothetical protein
MKGQSATESFFEIYSLFEAMSTAVRCFITGALDERQLTGSIQFCLDAHASFPRGIPSDMQA